jgi:hypothetical protein
MSQKSGPYILLITLLLILVLILGIRYGQNVEKTNQKVDCVLSITPTPPPPTPTSITYKDYKSKKNGIKYTFPANLDIKESTNSPAVLFEIKK